MRPFALQISQQPSRKQAPGFTLIEVMVALMVMALMALLTWQSVSGMSKATELHRSRSDNVASIQTGLHQWRVDLDHMIGDFQMPISPSLPDPAQTIDFDARVLRITRRGLGDELRVIAWGLLPDAQQRDSSLRWSRWVSEPVRNRTQWQAAWEQAARWGQRSDSSLQSSATRVLQAENWQIFFYRGNAWANAMSADGELELGSRAPDGIRLILELAPGQALSGPLSIDWVRPNVGGQKY
jgi:general secretion pathway protein J